jgi:hypothetical protein
MIYFMCYIKYMLGRGVGDGVGEGGVGEGGGHLELGAISGVGVGEEVDGKVHLLPSGDVHRCRRYLCIPEPHPNLHSLLYHYYYY